MIFLSKMFPTLKIFQIIIFHLWFLYNLILHVFIGFIKKIFSFISTDIPIYYFIIEFYLTQLLFASITKLACKSITHNPDNFITMITISSSLTFSSWKFSLCRLSVCQEVFYYFSNIFRELHSMVVFIGNIVFIYSCWLLNFSRKNTYLLINLGWFTSLLFFITSYLGLNMFFLVISLVNSIEILFSTISSLKIRIII